MLIWYDDDDDDDDSKSHVRPLLQLETVTSVLGASDTPWWTVQF